MGNGAAPATGFHVQAQQERRDPDPPSSQGGKIGIRHYRSGNLSANYEPSDHSSVHMALERTDHLICARGVKRIGLSNSNSAVLLLDLPEHVVFSELRALVDVHAEIDYGPLMLNLSLVAKRDRGRLTGRDSPFSVVELELRCLYLERGHRIRSTAAVATVETKSNTPSKATVSRTPHFILTWLLLHIRIEVDKLGGWEEEMSTNRNFLCLMLDEETLTIPVEG